MVAQTSSLTGKQAGSLRYFAESLGRQWFRAGAPSGALSKGRSKTAPLRNTEIGDCTIRRGVIRERKKRRPGVNRAALSEC